MSWEANTWATKQRMKLPQEQLVLIMLGNCADPDAVAFGTWPGRDHWWKYLSQITRLSRSSLFRHINTIVSLGLASRSFLVLADGSKRPTIRLNLGVSFNIEKEQERYIAATSRKLTESHDETHDECVAENSENYSDYNELEDEKQTIPEESHSETEDTSSPTHGTDRVPPAGLHIDSNIDSRFSPLPPSGGASAAKIDRDWDEFVSSWGEPIQRMALARTVWDRIASDKRPTAIAAMKGFWAYQRGQSKPKTAQSAQSFLRDEVGWAQWLRYTPDATGAANVRGMAYSAGSPEARAIEILHDIAGRSEAFRRLYRRPDGSVSARIPMTPQLRGLADHFAERGGARPLSRAQAAAWESFVSQFFDPQISRTRLREGDLAPYDWPPRKDGSLSKPENTLSDEDIANFK